MKLRRMLLLAVAVVTLVCVMTLSAFALDDLTGISSLNGAITGLDFDNNSYQISPILMKKHSTAYALAADSWSPFTADDNAGLSGLYKIRTVNGSTATSNACVVYVDPTIADKQGLGSRYVAATTDKENEIYSVGYDNTMGNSWFPGMFSTAYVTVGNYNAGTVDSYIGITYNDSHKWSPETYTDSGASQAAIDSKHVAFMPHSSSTNWQTFYPNPAYLINLASDVELTLPKSSTDSTTAKYTIKAGVLTKDKYLASVEKYSVKYAYKGTEVVKTKDFNSFSYAVRKRSNSSINIGQTKTKVRFYVYNANANAIEVFEAKDEDYLTSADLGVYTDHTVSSADAKLVTVSNDKETVTNITMASLDATWDETPRYIIGYELFPAVDTDINKMVLRNTNLTGAGNNGFESKIYNGRYNIDLPKTEASMEGVSYDPFVRTVFGITDTTKEYYLATYTLNGTNTDIDGDGVCYDIKIVPDADGKWTLPDDAPVGLLAMVAAGDEYVADSAPFLFYVYSAKAGHITCKVGDLILPVDASVPNYYGHAGQFSYNLTNVIAHPTLAPKAYSGGGAMTPKIYSITHGFCYQIIEKYYTRVSATITGATGDPKNIYTEVAVNEDKLEDIVFYYGFDSDEIFSIQDFDEFYIKKAIFCQGVGQKYAVECDEADDAEYDEATGKYYRIVTVDINKGVSFETIFTLYYLDTTDNTIKSHEISSGKVSLSGGVASLTFASDVSGLEGYVLGYSIKPYQNIDYAGHKTVFNHTLNFGGQCYWYIAEDENEKPNTATINSMTVGTHTYDFPFVAKIKDGRFATYDGDTSYYQYAPVTFAGGDNLSATIGEYNATPFQLSDAANTVTESGLYVLRRVDKDLNFVSSASNIVYFSNSTDETKRDLANIEAKYGFTVPSPQTPWQQGYWRDSVYYIINLSMGNYYGLTNSGNQLPFWAASVDGEGEIADRLYYQTEGGYTEDQIEADQKTVMDQVNALSLKYAYTDDEIIPAKDFDSFTYRVSQRQGSIILAKDTDSKNKNTKIIFYVANPDKTVTKYEKYIENANMRLGSSVGNPNENQKIIVTASDLLNDESQPLADSNGYIIGIEIYPTIIKDPTEIYAVKASHDPDENPETPQKYFNGSFTVDIVYGEYKFTPTPEAPKVSMVEGDILTVTDYNALYDYEYKAEGDEKWTTLNAKSVRVTSPATEYSVRILEGDYTHASKNVATVTSHDFIENGTSLILGGEIGIKTLFEVAEGKTLDVKCYDKDGTEITPVMSADGKSIIIYVPAKDRADGFKYSYTYDEETVTRDILTVAEYIALAKVDYASDENALTLVNAIDSYTTYADIYFDEDVTEYEAYTGDALASVTAPDTEFNKTDNNLTYKGAALILEGKTAIRHYFALADESSEGYVATVGDKKLDIQKDTDNGVYYVDIADIGAKDIGTPYTVTIKNGDATTTITYSVLNYLKNKDGANTKIGNLARAMYDYHKAAVAFDEN